jgi:hypothetical protein
MDPVTIGLLLGGTALGGIGSFLNKNDALENAKRQAEARNRVLAENIAIQQGFAGQNRGTFDANIGGYTPEAQNQRLQGAQDARTATSVGNISDSDANSVPISGTAPQAVRSEIAKRMLTVHDAAVSRAQAMGKLGGYGDAWQENQLGNNAASRDIGVVNNYSAGRKSLLAPEQEAAAAMAYKPPAIWGTLLQGAGNVMGAAAGAGMGGSLGGGANWNTSLPSGPGMINF